MTVTAAAATSVAETIAAGEGEPHRHSQPGRKQQHQRDDHSGKPAEIDPVERLQRLKKVMKKAVALGRQVLQALRSFIAAQAPRR